MKKHVVLLLFAAVTTLLLSGCGVLTVTPQRMQFAVEPTGNLGFSVDATGTVTYTERTMRFSNAAGANGAYLTGYEVEYYDGSDTLLGTGAPQSMNLFVPSGIQCDEPDEVYGCNMGSEGAVIAPGPAATTAETHQLMAAGVAQLMLDEMALTGYYPTDWYAEITFSGTTLRGQPFQTQSYSLWISPPN